MIRLTITQTTPDELEVRIEGDLDADSLPPLLTALANAPHAGRRTLNLAGVRAADEAARRELRTLRARGVRLTGASMYLARLLKETAP